MRLNKIKLQNIRSYLEQEINFPIGSVLLSGDIGSGKSSILLSIDFALFGISNDISGRSLLRNGEKTGSVELSFEIDGKEITIKRNLRRTKDSVVQEPGYLILDNIKNEYSPIELKQAILDLLNYPREMLTKSKDLIYKYTVYTPQEEMKQILMGNKDDRLDNLRKVFGIDRYKRIKNNSTILLKKLKEKRRELAGIISDLEEKITEKTTKENSLKQTEYKLNENNNKLKEINNFVNSKKQDIKKIEDDINKLNELNKKLEVCNTNLNHKTNQINDDQTKIDNLQNEIKQLKGDLLITDKVDKKQINYDINKINKEINIFDNSILEQSNKIREFEVKIESANLINNNLSSLAKCTICYQEVKEEYKQKILDDQNNLIKSSQYNISKSQELKNRAFTESERLKKELEELRKKEKDFEISTFKQETLTTKTNSLNELIALQTNLKIEIDNLNIENTKIDDEIKKLTNIHHTYNNLKQELEKLLETERNHDIQKAGFEQEIRGINENILNLNKEIERKTKSKLLLTELGEIQEWLDKQFISLMDIMERKIMLKVHGDFNSLFGKWFENLVGVEDIKVKLSEEFSPLVEQNGYEIDYNFLSGGEKTAAALAYRLALNQIINNVVSIIKTNDLLILDEPTDGFSSEQLDRMKLVLDELKINQIIIVSHESKIESFVDHVLRFRKEGHISRLE